MFLLDTGTDLILYRGVGVGGGSSSNTPPPAIHPHPPPPIFPISNVATQPLVSHPPPSDVSLPPAGSNVHRFSSLAMAKPPGNTISRPQFGSPLNRSPLNRDRNGTHTNAQGSFVNKGSPHQNNGADKGQGLDKSTNDGFDHNDNDRRDEHGEDSSQLVGNKGAMGGGDRGLSDRELIALVISPPPPTHTVPPYTQPVTHTPTNPLTRTHPHVLTHVHVPLFCSFSCSLLHIISPSLISCLLHY